MTQAEIEISIQTLNDHFSRLQRDRKDIRKHWLRIGFISLAFAVAFAVVGIVFSVISLWLNGPNPSTPFVMTMIPLFLLGLALLAGSRLSTPTRTETS
jgi:hypothetical protein